MTYLIALIHTLKNKKHIFNYSENQDKPVEETNNKIDHPNYDR